MGASATTGPVAVVGASLAGWHAASALAASPATSSVTVFGREPHLPYDRPPLSKEVLRGRWGAAEVALDPVEDPRVTWRTATTVVGLLGVGSEGGPRLRLDGGSEQEFPGGVVIATGGEPRTIAGAELAGVHVLRTLDDALALRGDIAAGPGQVVVVGGGFVGAEVAAACVEREVAVTVLEVQDVLFASALGPAVGAALERLHRSRGVDVRPGTGVRRLHGARRVEAVELTDGTLVPADVVVLGLGVVPCTGWLTDSGLTVDDGVHCDATLLAGPRVVAAGDLARWPNERFGEDRRVEHWDNAVRQGRHAGRRLLAEHGFGQVEVFTSVPWVWSDQYDTKLQVVGSTRDHDEVAVAHGSLDEDRFVALYRRGQYLVAAVGVNHAKLVSRYRRLLSRPVPWDEALRATVS